jgi:hypothetical protein
MNWYIDVLNGDDVEINDADIESRNGQLGYVSIINGEFIAVERPAPQ